MVSNTATAMPNEIASAVITTPVAILPRSRVTDAAIVSASRAAKGAMLIARLLPVVRTFIALPAGIARMPQVPFQIYTFVGSWPWCYALAYAGYLLGTRWDSDPRLRNVMHRLDLAVVGLVAIGIAWLAWRHFRELRS